MVRWQKIRVKKKIPITVPVSEKEKECSNCGELKSTWDLSDGKCLRCNISQR